MKKNAQGAVLSDAQWRVLSITCNFFPTTWASSSLALPQVVMIQYGDCFWKTNSLFSIFLLTVSDVQLCLL